MPSRSPSHPSRGRPWLRPATHVAAPVTGSADISGNGRRSAGAQLSAVAQAAALALGLGASGAALADEWLVSAHTCPGLNRTDALHRDADGSLWVGCGSNVNGFGLSWSIDGGVTWAAPPLARPNELDRFRVHSITRGADGRLKIAGSEEGSRRMVLALDIDGAEFDVSLALEGVNQVGRLFPVGGYRELADGSALAESNTGTPTLYNDRGLAGTSAANWVARSSIEQIADLVVFDGRFWGSGSRISEPPTLFLPSRLPGAAPNEFYIDQPTRSGSWTGELWGIAVNASRLVAVGVDQDNDIGRIFVSGPDPYDMTAYVEQSVSTIIGSPAARTWARGVCMRGDRIAVVGERQPLSAGTGLVLLSDDGGQTFTDITPAAVTASVSKCVIEPDGSLVVAGAGGFIGILPANPLIHRDGFESP